MKALLLILLAGAANALEIKAPSPNSGAITPSTVTITGTGSKCLSVDDPTLVVDCNLNRVGIGVAAPDEVLHVVGGVNPRIKLGGTSGSPGYILDGGTADAGIFNVSGLGDISLHTGDAFTQRMTILAANGNVGIGTASPCSTCTLHVAGGASVTGAFAVASATFTVATTGIVSAPSQPGVSASTVAVTSFDMNIPDSSWTQIYFGAESFDRQNMHSVTASSDSIAIPTGGDGIYITNGMIHYDSNATGTRMVAIYIDGALDTTGCSEYKLAGGTFGSTASFSCLRNYTAGQVVTLRTYQDSGGPRGYKLAALSLYKLP